MVLLLEGNKKPSFSEQISRGIDAAIPGIQGFLQQREMQQQKQQQLQALQKLGIDPAAANLPKEALPEFYKSQFSGENKAKEFKDKILENRKQLTHLGQSRGLEGNELKDFVDTYEQNVNLAEKVTKPKTKTQASQPIDPEQLQKIQKIRNSPAYESASPLRKYQMMTDAGVSKENAEAESKIAAEQQKPTQFETEADKLAAQSSSKYRDKVVNEYEAAQSSTMRLKKMMAKAKTGELSTPLMIKTLDFLGLPIGVLNNPTTEEYAKLENDFVKDVSSIFPGVIKNFEIEAYLKTIPRLLNSDEGKLLVGENLLLMDEAKVLRYKALEKILKENKGVTPRNADIAVNDMIRDQMENIKERFLNNVRQSDDLQGNKITMVDAQGNQYEVPTRHLEQAFNEGLKIFNE